MNLLTGIILWFVVGLINVIIVIGICMIEQKDYDSFSRELSNESDLIIGFFFSGILGFIVLLMAVVIVLFVERHVLKRIYNSTIISNIRERWNK